MKHSIDRGSDYLSAIRLFISSTFADMQPERDCFNDILANKLRALCRDRGVSFFSVDLRWGITGDDIANERLIPRCLSEVDKCRPFFLGIIGGRYGSQMESIPESLLAEYPWLKEKAGASYTELEITYHFLKDNTGENSLFLFKECEFTGSESDAQAMERLKAYIHKMAPGRIRAYRTLEDFQAIILEEFQRWLLEIYGQTDVHLERELLFARENDSHAAKNTAEAESIGSCIRQTTSAVMLHGKGPLGKTAIVNDVAKQFPQQIVVNCHADEANVYWPYVVVSVYKKIKALGLIAPGKDTWLAENEQRLCAGQLLSSQEEIRLKEVFLQLLSDACWETETVLAINDIENIRGRENQYLQWLPAEPPKGLHIVCSTNDEKILSSAKIMGWNLVELRPMARETAQIVLSGELEKLGKSVDDARGLLESPLAGYPGYLKMSIDFLNAFGSYDTVAELSAKLASAEDFFQFYQIIFRQVGLRYGDSSAEDLQLVLAALQLSALPLSEEGRYYVLHALRQREKAQWSGVSDVLAALRLVDMAGGLTGALNDYIAQAVCREDKENIHKALGQYWYALSQTPAGCDHRYLKTALYHFVESKQVDMILAILSDVTTVKALCNCDSDGLRRAVATVMFFSERNVGKLILTWMSELIDATPEKNTDSAQAIMQLFDFYGDLGLSKEGKRRDQLLERALLKQLVQYESIEERGKVDDAWAQAQRLFAMGGIPMVAEFLDMKIKDPSAKPKHRARYSLFKAEMKYRARCSTILEDVEEVMQLAVKAAAVDLILSAYDLKITALNWKHEYEDAYALAESAEQWARELGYIGNVMAYAQQKIVALYRTEKYDLALQESNRYRALNARWGNVNEEAVMKQNIATIYNLQKEYDACVSFTQECLKDKQLPDKYRIALLNVQKAAYFNNGQYDKARQTTRQALAEPALTEEQRIMFSLAHGAQWLMKGESSHPKAITEMEQAFAILQKRNNLAPIAYCLHGFFPVLVLSKEGKAFWKRWKERLGQDELYYQQTEDPEEAILNGAFLTEAVSEPMVSKSIHKLTESYRIAEERKNHARIAETAYDLGVIHEQKDPEKAVDYYLRSAEAFQTEGLFEKGQDSLLSALRLLIRKGTIADQGQYQRLQTLLDEKSAELVQQWIYAGTLLSNPLQSKKSIEVLRGIVSAGKAYEPLILAAVTDLSAQITEYWSAEEIQLLAELATEKGISDTIFFRLFSAVMEKGYALFESIFGQ